MEKSKTDSIAKTRQTGLATLPDEAIIKAVYQFNQLRAYSLTAVEIVEWARSIEQLAAPGPSKVAFVIDQMKLENLPYDERLGIQNIFRNLARVQFNGKNWEIIKMPY